MKNQLAEIRIGSHVYCKDGRAGAVERVVISPRRRAVTHLIVARGFPFHKHVVVPIERVTRVDEDHAYLDLTTRELGELPEYREIDYVVPDESWQPIEQYEPSQTLLSLDVLEATLAANQPAFIGPVVEHLREGVPEDAAVLRRGTPVGSRSGWVGVIDRVLLDPEGRHVTHLVVRRGVLLSKDVIVPVDWVTHVNDDHVFVGAGKEQLERLPEYKPDAVAGELPAMKQTPNERPEHGDQELEESSRAGDDAEESAANVNSEEDIGPQPQVFDSQAWSSYRSESTAGATMGLDYSWVDRFMFKTTTLHLSSAQAEEVVGRAEKKLFDFFAVAEETALENGRAVIYWHDLPLTKGFRATIRDYERFTRDLSPVDIESYLRSVGISNRLDLQVSERLPRLFGAFLLLTGKIILLMTPRGMSQRERLEWLTKQETNWPMHGEVERAGRILDLTL